MVSRIGVPGILQWRGFTWWEVGLGGADDTVQNSGFNEYRSRAWTVYFAHAQFKRILKIQLGGGLNPSKSPSEYASGQSLCRMVNSLSGQFMDW